MQTKHAMLVVLVCSVVATGSRGTPPPRPVALTGRFVARIDGPPLTGFGVNHQSYIFQRDSSSGTEFAILKYAFLIYQPQLSERVFDYSRSFTIRAIPDYSCGQTIEDMSKRFTFQGSQFAGIKYEISYSKDAPSLAAFMKMQLPCYILFPQAVQSIR